MVEILQGRASKHWDDGGFILAIGKIKGRPCDSCKHLDTCDDLECKIFESWCNEVEYGDNPEGITTAEAMKRFKVSRPALYQVPYTLWKYKAYFKIEDLEAYFTEKKPTLLNSKAFIQLTGLSMCMLKEYVRCGTIIPTVTHKRLNYYSQSLVDQIRTKWVGLGKREKRPQICE